MQGSTFARIARRCEPMNHHVPSWIGLAVVTCILSAPAGQPVFAEHDVEENGDALEWAEEGRNDLGLFLGVTHARDGNGFSAGLDYERRLNRRFGIGGTIEYTGNDFREGIAVVSFNWHPWKELKLLVAPGIQVQVQDDSGNYLLRLGGEYGFGIGKGFEIAPALNFDFNREEIVTVFGLVFAKRF